METVGFAIGVLGIIGAFKDAIELFALFTASRELGHDFVILLTKLDIEKFILLQWAEQVSLLDHDGEKFDNKRLNDPSIQESVTKILACIRLLLGDTSQLKERYGLSDGSSMRNLINIREDTPTMSGPCLDRFERQFRKLKLDMKERDGSTSVWAKARWVIQDKQKFADLISELTHFTAKLKEIVPPAANDRARNAELIGTRDLEDIHDLRKLKIVLEASTGHHGTIAESTQELIDHRCQDRILQTLWFRKIHDRREAITVAHQETLKWSLELPQKEKHWYNNLAAWLRDSSGIYWVSGKAGSGKSTLMKYLRSSHETESLLSQWSGGEKCNIADFFFWHLGTPEQNTQDGLSRALLYQILLTHPILVAKALPTLWKEVNDVRENITPPTPAETKYAFDVISSYHKLPPFCFFVDGLDEYVGNCKDGIALINRLAMNPRIKIVASSRPIPQCVAEFEDVPKLRLQDLTRGDISAYVQDVIGENNYMKKLLKNDPHRSKQIMHDLVERSSGVFLWVVLACRSLLVGFDDYDRISELQRRVDELPPELEDMFQHMLGRVDRRHRQQASRLLRLCYSRQVAQEQGASEWDGVYALELVASSDYQDVDAVPLRFVSDDERRELCKDLDGRLRSRCGGLLELVRTGSRDAENDFCFCSVADWDGSAPTGGSEPITHDYWADAKVGFMHRTVFEFLSGEKAWELDCLKTTDYEFDIDTAMSLSGLYLAVQSQRLRCPAEMAQAALCLRDGINWGTQADRNMPEGKENIFWKIAPLFDSFQALNDPTFGFWNDQFHDLAEAHSHERDGLFSHATLIVAIEAGAINYVKAHPSLPLMALQCYPSCGCLPLLYHATKSTSLLGDDQNGSSTKREFTTHSNEMIRALLLANCDPNSHVGNEHDANECEMATTPWIVWILSLVSHLSMPGMRHEERLAALNTLEAFLRAGADLKTTHIAFKTITDQFRRDDGLKEKIELISSLYLEQKHAQGIDFHGEQEDITQGPKPALAVSSHQRKRLNSDEIVLDSGWDPKRIKP